MSVVKKLLVWPTDLDLSSYILATKTVTVTFNTFANVVVKIEIDTHYLFDYNRS